MARKPDTAPAPQFVWYFEHVDGRRYEHVARVDKMHADGRAELSFQRRGELTRERATVPRLVPGYVGSGWVAR